LPPQLASFTADSKGNLTTKNTAKEMPTIAGSGINVMRMSPAGNLVAIATGTGVQIFHFNGSSPITKFTGVIGSSGYISALQWDKNNHLYAINGATGKLHVYTVTTTSAVEASGSPYAIGGSGLVVVPK
jgi:outer membrane protein assembly factor BamB